MKPVRPVFVHRVEKCQSARKSKNCKLDDENRLNWRRREPSPTDCTPREGSVPRWGLYHHFTCSTALTQYNCSTALTQCRDLLQCGLYWTQREFLSSVCCGNLQKRTRNWRKSILLSRLISSFAPRALSLQVLITHITTTGTTWHTSLDVYDNAQGTFFLFGLEQKDSELN